eukprot:TRINITY_DN3110_c0_g1_i1.p1 TRINITY_DN3110_c0_g1~~TRINITY_DN3110_c0_g1_i1.p1  ORF type:complete len:137 (-),score=27.17 TRINITY_DN3110_c0_g1_i1:90-500(-)
MGRRDKPVIIFTETQLAGQAAEQLRKEKDLAKRSTAKAISLGLIKPLKSSEVPRDFFAFAAKDATLRPGTADSSPNPYDPSKFDTAQIEKPTCNKCKKDGARCLHGTAGRAPPLPKVRIFISLSLPSSLPTRVMSD